MEGTTPFELLATESRLGWRTPHISYPESQWPQQYGSSFEVLQQLEIAPAAYNCYKNLYLPSASQKCGTTQYVWERPVPVLRLCSNTASIQHFRCSTGSRAAA